MEIYTLKVTNSTIMRYTSGPNDIDYDDGNGVQHYKAIPITRKEFTYDLTADKYEITAPLSEQFFLDLGIRDFVTSIDVNIRDTTTGIVLYSGNLESSKHDYKKGTVVLKCSQRYSELSGEVPKKTFAKRCSYNVGDRDCQVDMVAKGVNLVDFTISGPYITSDSLKNLPANYLHNGYVVANTGEAIWITGFNGSVGAVMLITRFYDDSKVTSMSAYPGCDKSFAICGSRFNNQVNFGGYPHIPDRNPNTQGFR
jgi:uncharacterized phage protein (TIGR02218 family)